jgi:hypothetical protein
MAHHDMARDGKPKPRATLVTRTCAIHTVEAFRQARNMVPRNAWAVISHTQQTPGARRRIIGE